MDLPGCLAGVRQTRSPPGGACRLGRAVQYRCNATRRTTSATAGAGRRRQPVPVQGASDGLRQITPPPSFLPGVSLISFPTSEQK